LAVFNKFSIVMRAEYQKGLDIFDKQNFRMDRQMLIMQCACLFFMYDPGARSPTCLETIPVLFCLQCYIHIHSAFDTNFMTGKARELHLCEL
jgi:hypothetical protein